MVYGIYLNYSLRCLLFTILMKFKFRDIVDIFAVTKSSSAKMVKEPFAALYICS